MSVPKPSPCRSPTAPFTGAPSTVAVNKETFCFSARLGYFHAYRKRIFAFPDAVSNLDPRSLDFRINGHIYGLPQSSKMTYQRNGTCHSSSAIKRGKSAAFVSLFLGCLRFRLSFAKGGIKERFLTTLVAIEYPGSKVAREVGKSMCYTRGNE
jgi:hypothetical protein